ncbi:MAG: methyltransferase domain-containing protein [Solirubrobacteraceae bacterium]|nr:methyltransferase domain-containing protein [Solirubrobacteraceae bacterium]
MDRDHAATVRRSFTGQAEAFESKRFVGNLVTEGEWVLDHLDPPEGAVALDVAAGSGHAARGLARRVASVVALDLTPAMLEAGRVAAEHEGLRNITFACGDALDLPFLDASFDVVVSRFAAHHFEEPRRLLAEMQRVTRPGGQLMVADLVADNDTAVADEQNRIEQLRDPSHVRCLSATELTQLVDELGVSDLKVEERTTARPVAPWLGQTTKAPRAESTIRAAFDAELAGGTPTGMGPHRRDHELWFEQRFVAVTARRR